MKFDVNEPWNVNISKYAPMLCGDHEYFLWSPGRAHYRLMAYLSTCIDNGLIIEVGTRFGSSAMCLSYNPTNKVETYDLIDYINGRIKIPNLEFKLENLLESEEKLSHLLKADLIFLDVDPHDGIKEKIVSDFLIKENYKGIMICDDIHATRFPELIKWYNNLDLKKYDLTELAAPQGLGLIDFGNNMEVV